MDKPTRRSGNRFGGFHRPRRVPSVPFSRWDDGYSLRSRQHCLVHLPQTAMLPPTPQDSWILLPRVAQDILKKAGFVYLVDKQTDGDLTTRAAIYETPLSVGWLRVQELSTSPRRV